MAFIETCNGQTSGFIKLVAQLVPLARVSSTDEFHRPDQDNAKVSYASLIGGTASDAARAISRQLRGWSTCTGQGRLHEAHAWWMGVLVLHLERREMMNA